jgi:hypothetical protein
MRSLLLIVAVGLSAGCQQSPLLQEDASAQPDPTPTMVEVSPTSRPALLEAPTSRPTLAGAVLLTGNVKNPGHRDLLSGQKVSDVLKTAELSAAATKLTLVLNRRSPEGMTREIIDLDQNLTIIDATRDCLLRDGDELVVSVVPTVPSGLSRPVTASAAPQ